MARSLSDLYTLLDVTEFILDENLPNVTHAFLDEHHSWKDGRIPRDHCFSTEESCLKNGNASFGCTGSYTCCLAESLCIGPSYCLKKGPACSSKKSATSTINESGLVETRIQQLHTLNIELQRQKFSAAADDSWRSSMFSLLMPLVGSLISLLLMITLGPLVLNRIIKFIKQQIDSLASKPLQIYYHRLDLADRGLAEPEDETIPTGNI
ncbi:uncharacterized protein LOC115292540 [Suricata suricatta]|uniref:uncharacterized protein LOC115292540 n=1 Tax=Suricata suricatta TaxID=37032 RepID=UPI001155E0AF|nr:uncharacterized protein LOC115292540 [Suricata suricatta]